MYKISLLVFLMGHTYIVVSQFLIKLLIAYGDTGAKAALKDERVFGSVKCHVLYFFSLFIIKPASSYLTKEEEQQ